MSANVFTRCCESILFTVQRVAIVTRPRKRVNDRGLSQYRTRFAHGQKNVFRSMRRTRRTTVTAVPDALCLCGLYVWPYENRVRQMFGLSGSSELRVSATAPTTGTAVTTTSGENCQTARGILPRNAGPCLKPAVRDIGFQISDCGSKLVSIPQSAIKIARRPTRDVLSTEVGGYTV